MAIIDGVTIVKAWTSNGHMSTAGPILEIMATDFLNLKFKKGNKYKI